MNLLPLLLALVLLASCGQHVHVRPDGSMVVTNTGDIGPGAIIEATGDGVRFTGPIDNSTGGRSITGAGVEIFKARTTQKMMESAMGVTSEGISEASRVIRR